ncbi:MAG: RibD family protein [Pseudomonadota bacterium]
MRYRATDALAALTEAPPDRPFVVGQLGQSLDGRIATPTGKSKYISGRRALMHLHRLRASVDAVLVGANTVLADDPQLTVRLVDGRSPRRVVIDPSGRLPKDLRLFRAGGLSVIRDAATVDETACAEAAAHGYEIIPLPRAEDGRIAPRAVVDALAERGLRRILLEGGSETLSHALAAGVVDVLHVMVAPIILGSGKPGIALPPIDELSEAAHPAAEVFAFDDGDALFVCDLRRARMAGRDDGAAGRQAAAE